MDPLPPLSSVVQNLLDAFTPKKEQATGEKITVNHVVSELASWYEKIRNSMDYREDEVVLRAAIERILKRRLITAKTGEKIAAPLVRELVWARYFPNGSLSRTVIDEIAKQIDAYVLLKLRILEHVRIKESRLTEWLLQILSASLAKTLNPQIEKETMTNFMYYVLQDEITIVDDTQERANAQVFLAVHRAFAKDDIAFLRYYLFTQLFGELFKERVEDIVNGFASGFMAIERELSYPIQDKIFLSVKRQTPVFLILEDILRKQNGDIESIANEQALFALVNDSCQSRYKSIATKIRKAIVRSVIFLLLTKVIFAFVIEGTYERIRFGEIRLSSIGLNTIIPPLLMVLVSLFIKTPGPKNTQIIYDRIKILLFQEKPVISAGARFRKNAQRRNATLLLIFTILWGLATMASFGLIIYVLTLLHFNIVSQVIFIFFVTIVSFLTFRINATAHMYAVEENQGLLTPVIDFFFLPIIRVGMKLTEGVSQVNLLIFFFDFFIDAPFKTLFGFFEQWFGFLHAKREGLE